MRLKLKVLILEDDAMIAEMTEEILVANDYEVCGVAEGSDAAMSLARLNTPDVALIDLRLANGERGTDVAARLQTLGRIGILYTTGNVARGGLEGAFGDARLIKPYAYDDLLRAIELVAEIVRTGEASPPFPASFQRLYNRV
jgi:CheY-like chemotaxis protein